MNTLKDEVKDLKATVNELKKQVDRFERLIAMDEIAFELMVNQEELKEEN